MGLFKRGRTKLTYGMFDLARDAAEAKRLHTCERIYHKGQVLAWDGKELLPELLAKHGGVHVAPDKQDALRRVFAIILWGELAAWKISAQLADGLVPLEAKMAATSQAFDEARHFYTMYDYLTELGYVPERLDPAPEALLNHVLETDNLAAKLLGMQLLIETIALAIFQEVREANVDPVLSELMRYFERDEARHVALGVQYLPSLFRDMSRADLLKLSLFQAKLVSYALWENKVLEPDFKRLGIDPRRILDRARAKQMAAVREAWGSLGWDVDSQRGVVMPLIGATVELMFPTESTRGSRRARLGAAWDALTKPLTTDPSALEVHARHRIRTARGEVVGTDGEEPGAGTASAAPPS